MSNLTTWRRALATVTLGLTFAGTVACSSASAAAGWAPTGSMASPRYDAASALLHDGRVLITGGDVPQPLASAELYDPATGQWSSAGSMHVARLESTATVLQDGRVLVTGGETTAGATADSEIYDPQTNTWTTTGSLNSPRALADAVLLDDGRVLIAGGTDGLNPLSSAEVFDPATGLWNPTGAMPSAVGGAAAAKLANGKVLVAGGDDSQYAESPRAMLYDPASGTWALTGSMATGRIYFSLLPMPDGTVLAAGGVNANSPLAGAERYDPKTGTWSSTGAMATGRYSNPGVALPDGRVLEVGGFGSLSTPFASSELYDPTAGTWSDGGSMSAGRGFASVTGLQDGRVLAAGGFGTSESGADLWTPSTTRTSDGANFGAQAVGSSTEQDVTVRVTGADRLFADGATLTGADASDFAIVSDGCTSASVAPGQSCAIRVRFTPGADGTRSASLVLDDNAQPSNPIALTGTGTTTSGGTPTPTPTPQPTPTPTPQPTPTPSPKLACVSRRLFDVTVHLPKGAHLKSGIATLNGHRIARLTPETRHVRVDLRGKPAAVYTLRIQLTPARTAGSPRSTATAPASRAGERP